MRSNDLLRNSPPRPALRLPKSDFELLKTRYQLTCQLKIVLITTLPIIQTKYCILLMESGCFCAPYEFGAASPHSICKLRVFIPPVAVEPFVH